MNINKIFKTYVNEKEIFFIPSHTEVCNECDGIIDVPQVFEGEYVKCPICNTTLTKLPKNPVRNPLVYSVTAIILFLFASMLPFISLKTSSFTSNMSIFDSFNVMYDQNYEVLSFLILMFIFVIPFLCMVLVSYIYGTIYFNIKSNDKLLKFFAKVLFTIKHWSMIDVYLVAIMVSMIKIISSADIIFNSGFFLFSLYTFIYIKVISNVDRGFLWSILLNKQPTLHKFELGEFGIDNSVTNCTCCEELVSTKNNYCENCGTEVSSRKKNSIQRCLAYLVTAIICYIPANCFPIMITETFGNYYESTIIGGVITLWTGDSKPIAMVIFFASIMIPLFKMLVLGFLCYSISKNNEKNPASKNTLYAITEFIGKWSMIDVFVVAILCSLLRFQGILAIYPSTAAISFSAVVIFTIFAANSLDSRMIWQNNKNNKKDV